MKKLVSTLLVLLFVTSFAVSSRAEQEKGWHKGIYILGGLGSMNNDKDTNILNNTAFGSKNLLGYNLTLGWNFLDFLATELSLRYATETVTAQKEHAANVDLFLKYSLILNVLTQWEKIQFLPYVKAGGGMYGAAVPDTSAGNNRFGVYGPAGVVAVGLETLLMKHFYLGADFTNHFVNLQAKSNAAGQRILNGGFDYQYSVFGYAGFHF